MKIPAYLESAAKKELKKIIDAGMIEKITHWTPQQSRGFFVEKRGKDEVSAHLVSNYRGLNRVKKEDRCAQGRELQYFQEA